MAGLRIVHISDLHMERTPERVNPGLSASLARSRALIRRQAPDYLFVTGDLTSFGAADPSALTLAKEWLDSLEVPYLAIAGNHDLGANPWRGTQYPELEAYSPAPLSETHFGRIMGGQALVARDLGVVLAVGVSLRNDDPDQVLNALDQTLAVSSRPTLVLAHYPLIHVRDDRVLGRFGASDYIPALVDPLRTILARHRHVRLYAAGHVHAVSARPLTDHAWQLTAGGLGPGASAFRVYDLDRQILHFSTVLGAGPLGFWERLVPDDGPYPVDYHLGSAAERQGSIALR